MGSPRHIITSSVIMGFLSRMCVLIVVLAVLIVCFPLGIVSLFVAYETSWFDRESLVGLAWGGITVNSKDDLDPPFPLSGYIDGKQFWYTANILEDDERTVMIAMSSVGFLFLVLAILSTPCLICGKMSGSMAALGCTGVSIFCAWVFYLTAWAYWMSVDPGYQNEFDARLDNDNFQKDHSWGPGFGCTVGLWVLLTLTLPCVCISGKMKNKD